MAGPPMIRQKLFSARTPRGGMLFLAFLREGGCAILEDDKVVEVWEDCERSLDAALERFLKLTDREIN